MTDPVDARRAALARLIDHAPLFPPASLPVPEAIAEGAFFQMQTLTKALIDLVVSGDVDQETAASAAPNRHDFLIALDRALKSLHSACVGACKDHKTRIAT